MAAGLSRFGLPPSLILTGQHADLDPADFGFDTYETTRLDCPGTVDPHRHVREVSKALLAMFDPPPDLLVVQGDTSSALGGARAGFRAGVPVAHVEAGLRSHDHARPWPEEEYRTAIDAGGELLFAPTALAAANLRDEHVPGAVFITGNTGIDAVLRASADLPSVALRESGGPRILVTCHRRESWANGLASLAAALRELAESGNAAIDVVLHPNPHVSNTLERLLGDCRGVTLVAPCSQRELLGRMRGCDLMLSDSGGVLEEAPALGVPLLVLRDKTELPEGIWSGNMRLVGTGTRQIVAAVQGLLQDPTKLAAMGRPSLPYGDGLSGYRIAGIIDQWLGRAA